MQFNAVIVLSIFLIQKSVMLLFEMLITYSVTNLVIQMYKTFSIVFHFTK